MEQAIENCTCKPDCLLIDAVNLQSFPVPQYSITKGDIRSLAIAAASIIAKVTRDREMMEWALKYPEYGFDRHMGYGTRQHIERIQKFGLSPIHRRTFCKELSPAIPDSRRKQFSNMGIPMNRKELGRWGEEMATRYLTHEKGFRIIDRNYRCPIGEIDLIAFPKTLLYLSRLKPAGL